jgi:hypothetical protein
MTLDLSIKTQRTMGLYLVICILIALPVIYFTWLFLFGTYYPSGADPADHAVMIMRILFKGELLSQYTQFPSLSENTSLGYYPTVLHFFVASLINLLFIPLEVDPIVNALRTFMLGLYVIGVVGYALLIKSIFDKTVTQSFPNIVNVRIGSVVYIALLTLAFGLFIYSTSPVIKTFRDGGYGEILGMWALFPFFMLAMNKNKLILAAILLAVIISVHNLAGIISLAAALIYILIGFATKQFAGRIRYLIASIAVFLVCSIPALVFYYIPPLLASINEETGTAFPISREDVQTHTTSNLFYMGLFMTVGILWIDYRNLGWIAIWTGFFIMIFFSPLFAERFVREFTIPLGLTVGLFSGLILLKLYPYFAKLRASRFFSPTLIALIVCILGTSFYYYYPRFLLYSDPVSLNYYSDAFAEADTYFIQQNNISDLENDDKDKPKIANFGMNQWIKPNSYGSFVPIEVIPTEDEKFFSVSDREINQDLHSILQGDNGKEIALKYNIQYVTLSGILDGRWYPESYLNEYSKLSAMRIPSYLELEKEIRGNEGEIIRIFSVK